MTKSREEQGEVTFRWSHNSEGQNETRSASPKQRGDWFPKLSMTTLGAGQEHFDPLLPFVDPLLANTNIWAESAFSSLLFSCMGNVLATFLVMPLSSGGI